MTKFLGSLFLVFAVVLALPVSAFADTMSVTQVVTVTARVAPARSIVVNDAGQMIKIYSNTAESVPPKVYLHDVPGQELPLTPQLQAQYDQTIGNSKHLVGVAIPVVPPRAASQKPASLLTKTVMTMLRPTHFMLHS